MYSIICYNNNKKEILNMNNYLSKELNIVKNDKTIETYLLVYNNNIYGIFSFRQNTNIIDIILIKICNILDKYIEEFIYKIINNIILDFDNINIYKNDIYPLHTFIKQLEETDLFIYNNNFIVSNKIVLHYKKKQTYNYFNCLFY